MPGWDCHGLPIEWIVEEKYRAKNQSKDSVPIEQFRQECREFAAHWVEVQKGSSSGSASIGDWDHPYTTMSFDAEAQIVREIGKFLVNGGLYKGAKPVLWSVVEQTALAEAEVEYHDHRSNTVWVRFPIVHAEPAGACRRGGGDLDDDALDLAGQPRDRLQRRSRIRRHPGRCGRRKAAARGPASALLVAEPLIEELAAQRRHRGAYGRGALSRRARSPARSRAHPLHGQGYDFDVPLLAADFVEADQRHRPRPYRAGARRRRLGARPGQRAAGARHGRAGRGLSAERAALRRRMRSTARTASRATPTRR